MEWHSLTPMWRQPNILLDNYTKSSSSVASADVWNQVRNKLYATLIAFAGAWDYCMVTLSYFFF